MGKLVYPQEAYEILGRCFEVHSNLGAGFLEIVYKDALEREFVDYGVPYEREKEFKVSYKGQALKHKFFADFTTHGKIILEVKAVNSVPEIFIAQCINYLKVSEYRLALLVNFGQPSLQFRRLVL